MRSIFSGLVKDLKNKMVFIGGPRQCGKTTLAQAILTHLDCENGLLNWDNDEDRQRILKKTWSDRDEVIGFDELHKYRNWKTWIKGVFDKRENHQTFLVTGSARLDVCQRGGDSLLGRYHYWRLHPFTLDELPPEIDKKQAFERLMTCGVFQSLFYPGI